MQAVLWWNCWVTVLECARAPDLCVPDWKWLTARAALGTLTHGSEEAGKRRWSGEWWRRSRRSKFDTGAKLESRTSSSASNSVTQLGERPGKLLFTFCVHSRTVFDRCELLQRLVLETQQSIVWSWGTKRSGFIGVSLDWVELCVALYLWVELPVVPTQVNLPI